MAVRPPRACILSVAGPVLSADEDAFLRDSQPWGVILMGRSCETKAQVQRLVDRIWGALERPCLIFIDQEGGRVARLRPLEWPLFPAGAQYGRVYAKDPEAGLRAVWLGYRLIAHELASLSIHADCAPVADLPVPGAHDVIGDRAFGTDPEPVAALARAALEGLAHGGVAGVVKHVPGHGRATADSHAELPRVADGGNELAKDFDAFARLADAPMAMTAHIAYDGIDPGVAATVSPKVIGDVVRGQIGFDGLLMSDDLGMAALGGDLAGRARAALAAGCDVVLHCAGFQRDPEVILREMQDVASAAGELTGDALERAQCAEAAAPRRQAFDVEAGWAELRDLMPEFGATA